MDSRTITAVMLSLVVWYGWMFYTGAFDPPPEEGVEDVQVVEGEPARPNAPTASTASPSATASTMPPVRTSTTVPVREMAFEGCNLRGILRTGSSGLGKAELTNHTAHYAIQPIYWWLLEKVTGTSTGEWKPYGDEPGPGVLASDQGRVLTVGVGPGVEAAEMDGAVDGNRWTLTGVTDGISVRSEFIAAGEPCAFNVSVSWRNDGPSTYDGGLWVGFHDAMPELESRFNLVRRPWASADESVESLDDVDGYEGPVPLEGTPEWFGFADNYFALVFAPQEPVDGRVVFNSTGSLEAPLFGGQYIVDRALPPGSTYTATFRGYAGTKDSEAMSAVDPRLATVVQLGWFSFFAEILLSGLRFFYGVFGNWGLAIIGLTVLIKAVFFPLTQMSFKSTQAMQAVQPELNRIREEHKDSPEKLNQEMMSLFKDNGVNPLGGCLPMLIQMPVWFALYSALLSSVELYHTEFWYIRDLSAPDPYGFMPIVVMGLMIVQQQFMPTGNMDPTQARVMKLMPLIFGFFFFSFPAGLVLYIFMNMLLSIAQQWYIKRTFKTVTTQTATEAGTPA